MSIALSKNEMSFEMQQEIKRKFTSPESFLSVQKRVASYPRVILTESLRGGVSSKAMMLKMRTHTQLYSRNYFPHQQL